MEKYPETLYIKWVPDDEGGIRLAFTEPIQDGITYRKVERKNMIYKIVTARNTSFHIGFPLDTAEDSPKLTSISDPVSIDDTPFWSVKMEYSNGVIVRVADVVEYWQK